MPPTARWKPTTSTRAAVRSASAGDPTARCGAPEIGAGQIGRIDPDGAVTEFALPDAAARPHAIAAGADGCWFTEWATNRVGHIAWSGDIDEFDLPASTSEPHGVAVGSDGSVRVAMESGAVLRLTTE